MGWKDAPIVGQESTRWQDAPIVGAGDTAPVKIGKDAFPDTLRQVLQETDWGTRNIAGAGTALTNLVEGAKQLVKGSELYNLSTNGRFALPGDAKPSPSSQSREIIREEAPVGALAGDIAVATPLFAAGGPSVPMAAGIGATYGGMQPANTEGQRFANSTIGAGLAAGGQAVANKATGWMAKKSADMAAKKSAHAPIDSTIKEAVDAGYVIPPGEVNPTFVNRQLESMGGKIATQQMASSKNQAVTDALARKAAGLMPDDPITPETLKAARDVIKKPYQEIAGLGLQPKLDALDAARAEANAAWREYGRQGTRAALNDFKKFSGEAKAIEKEIESSLFKANKPDLMRAFRDARIALAKNHDVETALIEGGGTIDAKAIGRMFQRGNKMTGELKTIGAFSNNFPKVSQSGNTMGTPDAHNLKWILSGALGAGGGMSGDPKYAALGLLPLLGGPAARSAMFSRAMQSALANPVYNVPVAARVGGGLLGYAPVGGTVLGLEAFNK